MTARTWIPISGETKKRLWIALLVSVGALVLCAMVPLVFTRIGSPEGEVVSTVALGAVLHVLCIAAVVTWHDSRARFTTVLGLVAALAAIATTVVAVWWANRVVYNPATWGYRGWFFPLRGGFWILALSFPACNLLSLFKLPSSWRFVRVFAFACIWGLALVLTVLFSNSLLGVWFNNDALVRLALCLALAGLFGVIGTVALHFRFMLKERVPSPVPAASLMVTCPACGLSQTLALGDSACSGCRLRFHIEVEAPTCPQCGYLCFQLASDRCPECGTVLATVPGAG